MGWEARETTKDSFIMEKGGHQDIQMEENFSVTHATFPSMRG
jgi:hypothetical protein